LHHLDAAIPVRLFIADAPDDSHWLGLAYDHWWRDSHSVRAMMRRLLADYAGAEKPPALHEGSAAPAGGFIAGVAESFRNWRRHRTVCRLALDDPLDFRTGLLREELDEGCVKNLRAAARGCGATVNDLVVTAAAQALGAHTLDARRGARRRRDIGIAVAVDTRPLLGMAEENATGFFLGYFSAVLRDVEKRTASELLGDVAAQTARHKGAHAALRLAAGFRVARIFWNAWRSPWRRALLFHRALPVDAGVSNVNLAGFAPECAGTLLDYVRVSPTGPLLPAVFTTTTFGGRMNVSFTYRRTAFSDAGAELLLGDFMRLLTAMATNAPSTVAATISEK
jgi:hypothetical protein